MIHITPEAALQIKEMLLERDPSANQGGLRIAVEGGGCSGMQYIMSFDQPKPNDKIFNEHEVSVLVDPDSLSYIDDSTVDFVSGLTATGFKIINPKAKQTCGCGTSFQA